GIDGAERPGDDALLPAGPRVVARATLARLAAATEQLWTLLDQTVRAEIAARGAAEVARELGFANELIRIRSRLAPPVRADFVPTRHGFKLVEWNVDPCLGGWAARRLFDGFARAGRARGLDCTDPAAALADA